MNIKFDDTAGQQNIIDLKNVSQSYDGASAMSGHLSGLQTRVREKVSEAVYVWCHAHRLNLVVEDICKDIPCLEHVFVVLGAIAAWFSRYVRVFLTIHSVAGTALGPTICD